MGFLLGFLLFSDLFLSDSSIRLDTRTITRYKKKSQVETDHRGLLTSKQHNFKWPQSDRKSSPYEVREIKTPKINIAPPSGLGLNGICKNRKRNSGVKQIE